MLLQDYIAYPAIFTQDKNGIYDVIIKYKNGEWHTCWIFHRKGSGNSQQRIR